MTVTACRCDSCSLPLRQLCSVATTVTACRYDSYSLPLRPLQSVATTFTVWRYDSYSLPLRQLQSVATTVSLPLLCHVMWPTFTAIYPNRLISSVFRMEKLSYILAIEAALSCESPVCIQHSTWPHCLETGDFNLLGLFLSNHIFICIILILPYNLIFLLSFFALFCLLFSYLHPFSSSSHYIPFREGSPWTVYSDLNPISVIIIIIIIIIIMQHSEMNP